MGSTSPGHAPGAHGKVNATCLLLSSASHHWPWTPTALAALPLCGVVRGGSQQDHPGFLPACPPVQHSDSSRPCPRPRVLGEASAPPILQTQACTVPDRAAHLTPSSQWPNCKFPSRGLPQATSSTRVSPQPPERWHLPAAAPSAPLLDPPPKPNQSPHHEHLAGRWQLDVGLFCLPGSCQAQSARAGMTQSPGDAASAAAYFKPSCLQSSCCGSAPLGVLAKRVALQGKTEAQPHDQTWAPHHHCLCDQQSLSSTQGASSKRGSALRNTPARGAARTLTMTQMNSSALSS